MEQLVIVIVIAVIGLVKWLMEKSAEQRAKRDTRERIERLERGEEQASPMMAPRPVAYPMRDPEAAARKLREALGLPEEHELPRPRPLADIPTPASFHIEEVKVIPAADLEQRVVAPPLPIPAKKLPSKAATVSRDATYASRAALDDLLRSREGLRSAILAQEVLGTPKGLVF